MFFLKDSILFPFSSVNHLSLCAGYYGAYALIKKLNKYQRKEIIFDHI